MSEERSSGVQVLGLAKMVALASRFFNSLAAHPLFQNGELDAAQWVALSLVSQSETTAVQLSRTMSISPQRAAAIAARLTETGVVAPKEENADVMLITNLGIERLTVLNARLEWLLLSMPSDPNHSIITATRHLTRLMGTLKATAEQPTPTDEA